LYLNLYPEGYRFIFLGKRGSIENGKKDTESAEDAESTERR